MANGCRGSKREGEASKGFADRDLCLVSGRHLIGAIGSLVVSMIGLNCLFVKLDTFKDVIIVPSAVYMCLLAASVIPIVLLKKKKKKTVEELQTAENSAFLFLSLALVIYHYGLTMGCLGDPVADLWLQGTALSFHKLLFVSLQVSTTHFVILNYLDSGLHALGFIHMMSWREEFVPLTLTHAFVDPLWPFLMRQLTTDSFYQSLGDTDKKRSFAEAALKRFISYIMHELRDPLSGTTILVDDFDGSLKKMRRACRQSRQRLQVAREKESMKEEPEQKQMRYRSESLELQPAVIPPDRHRTPSDCPSPPTLLVEEQIGRDIDDLEDRLTGLIDLTQLIIPQLGKMKDVCNDVLQLQKIESGDFQFESSKRDVREWLESCASQHARVFEPEGTPSEKRESPVSFTYEWEGSEVGGDSPAGVGDFRRLAQVVDNFLTNAKKFTPSGSVRVSAKVRSPTSKEEQEYRAALRGEEEEIAQWRQAVRVETGAPDTPKMTPRKACEHLGVLSVSVTDSGVGLLAEGFKLLFRPYSQIRAGELQNGGGTVLGLSLCKSFVRAHGGGRIWAESEGLGKGSTFTFEVFLPLVLRHEAIPIESSCARGSRRESILEFKVDAPCLMTPPAPATGAEGSSSASTGTAEKQRDTPQNRSSLGTSVTPSFSAVQESGAKRMGGRKAVDVLVVDDDRFCTLALSHVIRGLGLSYETAQNGKEAVTLMGVLPESHPMHGSDTHACAAADHTNALPIYPRLVVLDNNMPLMNGPETATAICSFFQSVEPEGEHRSPSSGTSKEEGEGGRSLRCPMLVGCTGETSEETTEAFLSAGVCEVVHKPLTKAKLLALLEKCKEKEMHDAKEASGRG
uniref:histidine kinase n=1 Tax=Chromera velia CCMP2878 TaxID=1169474 RepID=A0A0G4HZV7_9ALVE|eukprot:Cvel_9817.t1-p1 / transcript=Cvel_9817.t1 / gene=Cvel_9817 / organism=Chromera_velia_CCMP2878 / gene_product=Ethylene receptor, putative / transcript_product=Ethylene receptor, putative / location=Cvel_scaffold576:36321-43103(+) / protein_length=853 / sequence_SO=supercontig / SO=protein_coding / is_pseudo=false